MACQVAGEVRDFDVSAYIPAGDARRMDVFIHYGMAAGIQAVRDAGLETADLDPERGRRDHRLRHWRPADD